MRIVPSVPSALDDVDPRRRVRNVALTLVALAVGALVLIALQSIGSTKLTQALSLFAIWGVATVSLNLVNGTLGILSLGHHGFMLIGGYTTGLLMLSEDARGRILVSARSTMTDETLAISVANGLRAVGLDAFTTPETLWVRFVIALFCGGVVAAFAGLDRRLPEPAASRRLPSRLSYLRVRRDHPAVGVDAAVRAADERRPRFPGHRERVRKSVWWTFGSSPSPCS